MGTLRLSAYFVLCLAVASTSCGQKGFQPQGIMGGSPIHLDAEQVSMSLSQFECGVQNDLWDPPSAASAGDRTTARLEQAGRDLHFDDDVVVSEPGIRTPYVQIRGDFMMQLAGGASARDDGPDGRLVEGKLMVIVPHSCFSDPLPLLGVRKGQFSEDAQPVMEFRQVNEVWHFSRLVH